MIIMKIGGIYMKLLDQLALTIMILAGIHLFLFGVLDINAVELVFGSVDSLGSQIVHGVIGVSALWCTKYYGYSPKGGSRLKGR